MTRLTRIRISLIGILLLGTIFGIVGHCWPIVADYRPRARVGGTIFDPIGAVVVGAKVSVNGSSLGKETITNDVGEYEIELPPGTYSIGVTGLGFFSTRRATFSVREQDKPRFDFVLMVAPTHTPRPMTFEQFVLKSSEEGPRDFLVEFGQRAETKDSIHYEGFLAETTHYDSASPEIQLRRTFFNAAATHNWWTVSGKRLTLDRRTLRFLVERDVRISDGTRRISGTRAEIDFSLRNPVVDIKD